MMFAWCIREGTRWSYDDLDGAGWVPTVLHISNMGGLIYHALTLTFLGIVGIFILDCVDDNTYEANEAFKRLINAAIDSIGILIGVSWELPFEMGMLNLVSGAERRYVYELLLTLC